MQGFLPQLEAKRRRNASDLAAFGIDATASVDEQRFRQVREGDGPTIFTIGYERRDGEELVSLLLDAGVDTLVDVRERAMSRRADFRGKALRARCEEAGIAYLPMQQLGSTDQMRDELKGSRDYDAFHRTFRAYAERELEEPLLRLADEARQRTVCLICYERAHEECHRSTVADLVADAANASITAII